MAMPKLKSLLKSSEVYDYLLSLVRLFCRNGETMMHAEGQSVRQNLYQ